MTTPSDHRDETTTASGSASPRPLAAARGDAAQPEPDAAAPREPVLDVGHVVAGRYRIVRFVAHGGMGEVYEAEDLELHENVALKRLLPEIAASRRAIDRFKREIQLARRVTHPNVCRIFDIGFDAAGRAFLTMELLEGETLAARIRQGGPLSMEAALPIVEQMSAALGALHAAGIIHRDFKSQNVLLTSDRAVVTDFGLARVSSGEQLADMASCTGALVGSPATMAPEQVEGKKVTPAADVYALGVVLFEMMTGRLPFNGPTPLATAFKRLQQDPPAPRSLAPDLTPRWEAAILRCLRRTPEDRFASAVDVASALTGKKVAEAPRRGASRRRSGWLVGAAAVLALGAIGVAVSRRTPDAAGSGTEGLARRRSVAVLGFKNLSGREETAWLSTALSEMLRTELAAAQRVRLVPGESVARMKVDLSLADADTFANDTLERIQKNIDADVVVVGSYTALGRDAGGKIRFDVRVQDTHAGELIASVSESGTEAELLELVTRTGKRLRESLHAEPAPGAQRAQAALPDNAEVTRLYSEGLARLRSFDATGAKDLLERALEADPTCALTHSALSQALGDLGFEQRAAEEAKRAFELVADLNREDKLVVEGRFHEAARDWPKAISTYRTLFDAFPDNPDYGLRLAAAQAFAGKYTDASATVAALRRLAGPKSDDPRLDLAEAWATPDYRVQQAAASRAAQKGRARGQRLLVAEAENSLAMAYLYEGEPDLAVAATERSRQLYAEVGNDHGEIWSLTALARALWAKGEVGAAIAKNDEAARIAGRIGARAAMTKNLFQAALYEASRGDVAGARARRDEAVKLSGDVQKNFCDNCSIPLDGWLAFLTGDLAGAAANYEKFLELARESEDVNDSGILMGELLLARGELAPARARFEEALKTFAAKGVVLMAPAAQLGVGMTYLEQGRAAKAEASFREALAGAQKMKSTCVEATAWAALARAVAAERRDEAQAAIAHALELWPKVETLRGRVVVASTAMLLRGDASDRQRAEATLAEATRAGALPYVFELRLALTPRGRRLGSDDLARLAALEKEAGGKGYALVARKAAAMRRPAAPAERAEPHDDHDDDDEHEPPPER